MMQIKIQIIPINIKILIQYNTMKIILSPSSGNLGDTASQLD